MKNTLLAAGICLIVIAAAAALYFTNGGVIASSNDTAAAAGQTKVPIIVLAQGSSVSNAPKVNYRIETQKQLNKVWEIAYGSSTPPTIDFSKNDVLAVFGGSEDTTGYSVLISKIADGVTGRIVTIKHLTPGDGCMASPATIEPFEFVMVPTTNLPMSHTDVNATVSCNS